MAGLCGKGIWLAHSYDLQRAVEMATGMDGTHLIVKVGHGPHYFPEVAPLLMNRARSLGFRPLAWLQVADRDPAAALTTLRKASELGYEALILSLDSTGLTARQVQPLVDAIEKSDLALNRLILASPPLAHLPHGEPLKALASVCQGGWMPFCFPDWNDRPQDLIDREVYQSLGDLTLLWGTTPPIYPVLAATYFQSDRPFLPEDLIPWVEAIIRHGVDFFSAYHAASTEKAFWPILEAASVACQGEVVTAATELAEAGGVVPQPVYITVTASDTVGGLVGRYEMSRQQFWEWNAHLWESRGLPRDADYLQEGWRVRVK